MFFFSVDAVDLPFLNAYLDSIGATVFQKQLDQLSLQQLQIRLTLSPSEFKSIFKARVIELLTEGTIFLV